MPIFEYQCSKCGNLFEELVLSPDKKVKCPRCGSTKIDKLFSTFARTCKGCEASRGPT